MPQSDKRKILSDAEFGPAIENLITRVALGPVKSAGAPGDAVDIELKFEVHFTKGGGTTERMTICCICWRGDEGIVICKGQGSSPCCP